MKALLAALLLLAAASGRARTAPAAGAEAPAALTLRTPEELAAFWKANGQGRPLPEVDFSKVTVTATPLSGGGWELTATARPAPSALSAKGAKARERAAAQAAAATKKAREWAIVLRGGPTFTDYARSDLHVETPRMRIDVPDAEIGERNSMEWYRPANLARKPFHWIDEPTNDFTLGLENRKKGYAINFTARHPKFLILETQRFNENARVIGTVDGKAVDKRMELDSLFSHWRLTHRLMHYQAQAEKLVAVDTRTGRFTLAPGVGVGFFTGLANAGYSDREDGPPPADGVIGKSLSAAIRGSFEVWRINANVSYEWTRAALDYPFLDGRASHRLDNKTLTFQLGVVVRK